MGALHGAGPLAKVAAARIQMKRTAASTLGAVFFAPVAGMEI
jgi:hypothetical protein